MTFSYPTLTTDRLILRAPTAADVDPWMAFLTSDRGTWHGAGPKEGAGRAWRAVATLLGHWQIHGFGPFVARLKSDNTPVASVGAFFPNDWPERELGWSVWRDTDEGKGYAVEAARAVIRHYFEDLRWDSLVSYIDPANERSVALAERLGAQRDDAAKRTHPEDLVYRHPKGLA